MTSDASRKSALKVVFLTLFLDMVGFSIIFPLFPAMLEHYLVTDPANVFLTAILNVATALIRFGGAAGTSNTVLFGGVLAGLYSLLQFAFSPFWGGLSDRIGRKPILVISIAGNTLGYLLWVFSGSFTLLVVARVISGVMSGNISTATAVVGDITGRDARAKGMAVIGIAFGTGFILGPALGGFFSLFDLTRSHPEWSAFGINPFSVPALAAFALAIANLFSVLVNFPETLPPHKRGVPTSFRTANVFAMFRPLPYRGVNLSNFANFLYTTAFAGMEFTLTFLAVERLAYTSRENALMFVFVGVIIALAQGGIVRRFAHRVGEKRMVVFGLILLIPGLLLISSARTSAILYSGLAFVSMGSALVIACLSALVSIYTPEDQQGRSIGIFRSLGALGRVIGPIGACLLYWRYGASAPYYVSAGFMLLPLFLVLSLEPPQIAPHSP